MQRWRHRCSDGLIDDTGKIRNVFTRTNADADDNVDRVIRELNKIPEAVAELEVAVIAQEKLSKLGRDQVQVPVRNARLLPETSLHTNGFVLAQHTSAVTNWEDNRQLTDIYSDEICALVKRVVGATHAFSSNHLLRQSEPATGGNGPLAGLMSQSRGPVHAVHNDFTETYGEGIINTVASGGVPHTQTFGLTDAIIKAGVSAEALRNSRILVINTWRAVTEQPLQENPLAVADRRTISYGALRRSLIGKVPCGQPRGGIETFTVVHEPEHEWFFYPNMTSAELLLWKGYDSDEVPAQPPLHSSFNDPTTPADAPERKSVEVRVLCLLPRS